jgi:hypothetical protein
MRKQTPKYLPNGVTTVTAVPVAQSPALVSTSKLPSSLRFPLVVISNLALSAFFYAISSEFAAGDLSSVSRSINEWWEIGGLLLAKTAELAVGWWGQYDGRSFGVGSDVAPEEMGSLIEGGLMGV